MGNRRSAHPALMDSSTGLPNREYFDALYGVIFGLGDRGIPISVLMLKVDTPAGDLGEGSERVIQRMGEVLKDATRGADLYAHVGDGLFAAILLDCNAQGALTVAHRLEDALVVWRDETGHTVSIGVAAWRPELDGPDALLELARNALLDAQSQGGGQAQLAPR